MFAPFHQSASGWRMTEDSRVRTLEAKSGRLATNHPNLPVLKHNWQRENVEVFAFQILGGCDQLVFVSTVQDSASRGFVGRGREIAELSSGLDRRDRRDAAACSSSPANRESAKLVSRKNLRPTPHRAGCEWCGADAGKAEARRPICPGSTSCARSFSTRRRDRERHSALPAEIAQLIPELSSETTMPRSLCRSGSGALSAVRRDCDSAQAGREFRTAADSP